MCRRTRWPHVLRGGSGFESRSGLGCLSLVNVVYCQVEVLATGRSVVQRVSPDCVCVCVCQYDHAQQ